ncbi:MAG TPA: queuosine precursor transporter [Phycisphaerae bacterium]
MSNGERATPIGVGRTRTDERKTTLFLILAAIFLGNALLAELIGGKLFSVRTPWGIFTLSTGIILWPVVFITTDIINEYFGRRGVQRMSILAAAMIAYAYVALFCCRFVRAADFSPVDDASFDRVFLQSQWIIVGSLIAFLLAQLIDVNVFWILRRRTGHKLLWLRATGSTLVSQLIDTFVVQFIGLYLPFALHVGKGIDFAQYLNSAGSGYLFKCVVAIGVTPVLYIVHGVIDRWLGHAAEEMIEGVARSEHADDATVLSACPDCGRENEPSAQHCGACGAPLPWAMRP